MRAICLSHVFSRQVDFKFVVIKLRLLSFKKGGLTGPARQLMLGCAWARWYGFVCVLCVQVECEWMDDIKFETKFSSIERLIDRVTSSIRSISFWFQQIVYFNIYRCAHNFRTLWPNSFPPLTAIFAFRHLVCIFVSSLPIHKQMWHLPPSTIVV